MLGIPAFGLTFAVTTLTAYLPVFLHSLVNPIFVGLIIGGEGIFSLFIPFIFGVLSDRAKTVAGRWHYLVPAVGAMASALILMGLIRHLAVIAPMVALFYLGYFAYLAPYWATYPDIIDKAHAGRSRSAESVWRVTGAFFALVGSGFLLSAWKPLPFIVSAGLVVTVTLIFGWIIKGYYRTPIKTEDRQVTTAARQSWRLLKSHSNIRNLLIANALWNATLQSIQAFTVLFFTQGLHRSTSFVSGVIFPIAAIGLLIMAPISGKLADRYSHYRVLLIACLIYGLGDLLPVFSQASVIILIIPLVSGAAATVMTLPYAALMRLMGKEHHGALSGLFGVSRGIGTFLGPLLTGVTVVVASNIFKSTNGWAGMWLACGLFMLVSLLFFMRLSPKAI